MVGDLDIVVRMLYGDVVGVEVVVFKGFFCGFRVFKIFFYD